MTLVGASPLHQLASAAPEPPKPGLRRRRVLTMVPKIYSPRFTSIGRTHSNSHLYSRSAIFYAKFSYLYTFFLRETF